MAATAPSEAAVIICLSGFVRRSPVANTPSILVLVVSSAMTYPSLSVFKWNLKSRVLGVFPIATNIPLQSMTPFLPEVLSVRESPVTTPSSDNRPEISV